MEKVKIGTLRCKLFGHKLVYSHDTLNAEREIIARNTTKIDYCIRCGITRKELTHTNTKEE